MIRSILVATALLATASSASAVIVCHDARHHVIKCVRRPLVHHTVVRRTVVTRGVYHRPHVLVCHDARGRKIVCHRR